MLIRLLRKYLRPYLREVSIVVVLVLVQAIGNLYLPNLNADIINNGVAKGDIPYIWRTGGLMLAVTVGMGIISIFGIYWASKASMGVTHSLAKWPKKGTNSDYPFLFYGARSRASFGL